MMDDQPTQQNSNAAPSATSSGYWQWHPAAERAAPLAVPGAGPGDPAAGALSGGAQEGAALGLDRPRSRRRAVLVSSGIAAVIAAFGIGGVVAINSPIAVAGRGAASPRLVPDSAHGPTGTGSGGGSTHSGSGRGGGPDGSADASGGDATGGESPGGNSADPGSASSGRGTATATQAVGVVDIDTVLRYRGAQAAGTGLVLNAAGEILTNNHVIDGATSITVTVVSTGQAYTAVVVGTDPTQDIAVLQLQDASGLTPAKVSSSASVTIGLAVTAVGNAGGSGGTPSTASGTVLALNQSITATDENGANSENLTGLIESNAPIAAGDSGGPLFDGAGDIIGINTAGSSPSRSSSPALSPRAATEAYSIPISTALSIARTIESGPPSATVHLGYPAFLGVELSSGTTTRRGQQRTPAATGAALIGGVLTGSPAARAGLSAGDTITAVGPSTINSPTDLSVALADYQAGQSVKITWTDATGAAQTATLTLIQGPAD